MPKSRKRKKAKVNVLMDKLGSNVQQINAGISEIHNLMAELRQLTKEEAPCSDSPSSEK